MKDRYHIPFTLDAHFGDVKTKLVTETGQGIDHEFTVRGLLTTFAAGAIWIYLITHEPIFSDGSIPGVILFTLGYAGVCYFGLREISIPGLYGYNILGPLLRYMKHAKSPEIQTASFSPYWNGVDVTGMGEPDDQGFLRFKDGSYGIVYKIVGNASNNAFSIDRKHSIDAFNQFLRTLPSSTTYSFITNVGGQNVDRQLAHLFDCYDNEHDANMISYIAEEIQELGNYVQNNFMALHQYMIIRGDTKTAMKNANNQTRIFIEQNADVIAYMERPTPEDEEKFFKSIYSGLEKHVNDRLAEFNKKHQGKSGLETAGSRAKHHRQQINVRKKINLKIEKRN